MNIHEYAWDKYTRKKGAKISRWLPTNHITFAIVSTPKRNELCTRAAALVSINTHSESSRIRIMFFFLVWIDRKTLPRVIRPKSPGQHCVRRDGHEDRTTGDNHRVDAQVEACVSEAGRGRTDTGGKGRRQIHETSKTPPSPKYTKAV